MELKQLRALQAIAETGSFVLAAERLGLTQSALSHQIRNLEEEFEETMLVRARPHVYPTSVGAAVLESAKTIIEEMVKLEARFLGSKKGPMPGTLRLAVSNMSLIYVLADICEVFIARHPEIELVIRATETTEEALRRVLIGTADLAFSPFLSKQEQLTRLMLGSTEHAFIVAPSHPLGDRKTVSLQDLQKYPFVLFAPGSGTRDLSDQLFLSSGNYPRILTESNDAQFIKKMVSLGSASALMPAFALSEEAANGKLTLLRYEDGPLMADFGLVHRNNVRMHSIELFVSVSLDVRGSNRGRIMIGDADLHFVRKRPGIPP